MRRTRPALLLGALALVLSACNSSTRTSAPPTPPQPDSFDLRVIHASPDAPQVNVLLDGDTVLDGFDYGESTAFGIFEPGSYDIVVEAITPGGNLPVISLEGVALEADMQYSVFAVGRVGAAGEASAALAAPPLQELVVAVPRAEVTPGTMRATVVHASPDAPAVDVYVTGPDDSLGAADPAGTFAFGEVLGPVELPAGPARVRVTAENDAHTVLYDSGEVTLPDGGDVLFAAITNTGAGQDVSPIAILVNDGSGPGGLLLDEATPAEVRVVHASADAPAVDVIVDGDLSAPLVAGIEFPSATDYLDVDPGAYDISVVDSATQTLAPIEIEGIQLPAGRSFTVIAAGQLGLVDDPLSIQELILADNKRRIALEARLRLVHASTLAGPVDIYVLPVGTLPAEADPLFDNVPFGAQTGYVPVIPGVYDIYVTPTGDPGTLAISATGFPLDEFGIYTGIALDPAGLDGPLGLLLIDDEPEPLVD